MKLKHILLTCILVVILFSLTACSNNTYNSSDKEITTKENLKLNGTGEISLKEFIESPSIEDTAWVSQTFNTLKSRSGTNSKYARSTMMYNGKQFDVSYDDGQDSYVTTKVDDKEVYYTEQVLTISDDIAAKISFLSEPYSIGKDVPETLSIDKCYYSVTLTIPDVDKKSVKNSVDNAAFLYPYLQKYNCFSIKAIAETLGMNLTDKSMIKAIENNLEYSAQYTSEFGTIDAFYEYSKDSEGVTKSLTFVVKDETSSFWRAEIHETSHKNGYENLDINLFKRNKFSY